MQIIHANPNFLIINKPSGLLTHPNKPGEPSLVDDLMARFKEIKNVSPDMLRPGIVHRLDKETSGILVVARTQAMYDHLRQQFDQGKVDKEYVALVYGAMPQTQGAINLPISRSKKGIFTAGALGGREAVTEYKVTQTYPLPPTSYKLPPTSSELPATSYKLPPTSYSLLSLHPKTGRTHQLRVHLHALGHPIVGDPLYRAKIKIRIDFPRLFLHAGRIGFTDLKGAWKEFEAPMPGELQKFLKTLK
jgi:23S rRNA pseudouridine1911/1915/1917 synthase